MQTAAGPLCLAADAFNYFGRQGLATQADSARRLAAMQQALPGLVIIPTHDPFDYTYKLVQPFLADGVLTEEERRELLAYQARLYDDAGRLKAEAMPHWEKGEDGYGRVWAEVS